MGSKSSTANSTRPHQNLWNTPPLNTISNTIQPPITMIITFWIAVTTTLLVNLRKQGWYFLLTKIAYEKWAVYLRSSFDFGPFKAMGESVERLNRSRSSGTKWHQHWYKPLAFASWLQAITWAIINVSSTWPSGIYPNTMSTLSIFRLRLKYHISNYMHIFHGQCVKR